MRQDKIALVEDKITNSIELRIKEEDHTLGNVLSHALQTMPEVSFAAYKVPHPLKDAVHVKVSLRDAEASVLDAVKVALDTLVQTCERLETELGLQQRG